MRLIYIDEAGTSALEPESVVAGVVLEPDSQWRKAEAEIKRVVERDVPAEFQDGFIFHAKDIFAGGRYRDLWTFEQRLGFLLSIVSIPRRLGMAICYGTVKRLSSYEVGGGEREVKIKKHELDHIMAFMYCIVASDRLMRIQTWEKEIAVVVAEDVESVKRYLKKIPDHLRNTSIHLGPEDIRTDVTDITEDKKNNGVEISVKRIVDCAHFAAKKEAPLLQLADACAFSLRRGLNQQKFGRLLVTTMLGRDINYDDFSGPSNFGSWLPGWKSNLLRFC